MNNCLNNLLWIGIFSLILHVIGASDPEPKPKDQTKISNRQEKGLEIEFPYKEVSGGQSTKFNLNNYASFVKFEGKTCTQGIAGKFRRIGTKPIKNIKKTGKYAAKMKNLRAQGIKPQSHKNLRLFFDPIFWASNLFSGQASVSATPNNYNNYCDTICSSKFSFFSNGECFNTSPYYASKPCDCLCAYSATDYANTEYELCVPENPSKCDLFCKGLDPDYFPYNAGYDDYLMYKSGRCSNGQCYCCGKYNDANMIDIVDED